MIGNIKKTPRPSYRVCPVGVNGDIYASVAQFRSPDKAKAKAVELHAVPRHGLYEMAYRDHYVVVETRHEIHCSTADVPSS